MPEPQNLHHPEPNDDFGLPPMTRDRFLAATLGELDGLFVDVDCAGCTKVATLPLKLMAAKHGRSQQLHSMLARMRCADCGGAVAAASIQDSLITPHRGYVGTAATWRIALRP